MPPYFPLSKPSLLQQPAVVATTSTGAVASFLGAGAFFCYMRSKAAANRGRLLAKGVDVVQAKPATTPTTPGSIATDKVTAASI